MVSARVRRRQVAYAKTRGLSKRRACELLSTARSGLCYSSRRVKAVAPVLERMSELAAMEAVKALKLDEPGRRRVAAFVRKHANDLPTWIACSRLSEDEVHKHRRAAWARLRYDCGAEERSGSDNPAAPTRMANTISGSTSPSILR